VKFTRVVHATTLFTNALIERRGALTGLLTTAGFADTLEIGRERKFELYDLNIAKPSRWCPVRCAWKWPSACAPTARWRASSTRARWPPVRTSWRTPA